MDLVLALAVTALWACAGLLAGVLPRSTTAVALRRRALVALGIVALASVGTALTVLLVDGRPLIQVPLLLLPAAVVLVLSTPRLLRLRDTTRVLAAAGPGTPAPPAVRAAGAHPRIVVPVQVAAYGSVAAPVAAAGLLGSYGTALLVGFVAATVVILGRHALRHRRLVAVAIRVRPVRRRPSARPSAALRPVALRPAVRGSSPV